MLILALDTAGKTASCALLKDGDILDYAEKDSILDHSRTLLPMCGEMLEKQGVSLCDIDAFAAVTGPGSFTGIRIGTAAVKGFAWAGGKPCVAVSSLLATAYASPRDGVFCATVGARENEYYYAFFEKRGSAVKRLTPDKVAMSDDISAMLKNEYADAFVVGGMPEHFPSIGLCIDCIHNGAFAAKAAFDLALSGGTCDCHDINPSYLRITQAERMRIERETHQ